MRPGPRHVDPARRTREPSLVLERYRLERRLGAGGFGTVWLARDERLERDVAIKILPRERVHGGRFEREARAAARLSHPGIVTLYEAAVDDDGAYLVSELVRGETLGDMLDAGRMSDHDIAQVAVVMCDALAHAHAHGIVHRDVKPSNVLIPEHPPSPSQLAKLTDFGVARVIGGATLTRTGDVIGTAAYMAPEQAEGLKVGAAADVYSLALVTYEALTGVNPVRTGTAAQRARRLGAHLPPLRRQRRDLPQGLGRAVDLALRPRARERGSLEELQAALVEALPTLAETPGVVTGPWPRLATDPPTGDHEVDVARWSDATGAEAARRGARPASHTDEPASDEAAEAMQMPAWPERGLAGAATAALIWWLSISVLAHPVIAPAAAALVAAVIVAALPRIGWVVAMGSLVVAGGGSAAARGGGADRGRRPGSNRPDAAAGHGVEPRGRGARAGARRPRRRVAGARRARRDRLAPGGSWGHGLDLDRPDRAARWYEHVPEPASRHAATAHLERVAEPDGDRRSSADPHLGRARRRAGVGGRGCDAALAGKGSLVDARYSVRCRLVGHAGFCDRRRDLDRARRDHATDRENGLDRYVRGCADRACSKLARTVAHRPRSRRSFVAWERPAGQLMSVLRSLESKIAGLVEGTFSRAFRSEVRPVEIARKLAREMEEHKSLSVSRTYVPNEYRVFLSPRDRERFADYEDALATELAGYLLEYARRERLALMARPVIEFETDDRLGLGEFGIQTGPIQAPQDAPAEPIQVPDEQPQSGRTMIYSAAGRVSEPLEERARSRAQTVLLLLDGKRLVVGPTGATLGRSRQCDVVLNDPNVSRQHAEIRPRGGSWVLSDLGSTNGSCLNGRRIDSPEVLKRGDEIELGTSALTFELE